MLKVACGQKCLFVAGTEILLRGEMHVKCRAPSWLSFMWSRIRLLLLDADATDHSKLRPTTIWSAYDHMTLTPSVVSTIVSKTRGSKS